MRTRMLLSLGIASCFVLLPWQGTLSFLTSEQRNTAPVSLGTNEDVFVTETKSVSLVTQVKKKVRVTRLLKPDGTVEEQEEAETNIETGRASVVFVHQRSGLHLDADDVSVEGDAAGEVDVDVTHDEERSIVMVQHKRKAVKEESGRAKGTLRIRALDGFYQLELPLAVVTKYDEDRLVQEVLVPPPASGDSPQQPGAGEPPAQGGPPSSLPPGPPPAQTDPPAGSLPVDDGGVPSEPSGGDEGGVPSEPSGGDEGGVPSEPSGGGEGGVPSEPSGGGEGGVPSEPSGGDQGGVPSDPPGGDEGEVPSEPSGGGEGGVPSDPPGGDEGEVPSDAPGGDEGEVPSKPSAADARPVQDGSSPDAD